MKSVVRGGKYYICSINHLSDIIHRLFNRILSPVSLVLKYLLCRWGWWRRKWQATPAFLPRKSCGQRSLVGCCLWDRTARHDWSDLECMHALEKEMATHSSVLAWRVPGTEGRWAAVYGVTQSWTRLKRLSSSSRWGWTSYIHVFSLTPKLMIFFEHSGIYSLACPK